MWNNLNPTDCLLLLVKSSVWWYFYLKSDLMPIFCFYSQNLIFLLLLSLTGSSTLRWQQPADETLHKARPWALQAHTFVQVSGVILTCTFCDLTVEMTNKMLRAKKCFRGLKDQHDVNRVNLTSHQYWHAGWEQKTLLPKCCTTAENYHNGRKVDWKALEENMSILEERVHQPKTLGKS